MDGERDDEKGPDSAEGEKSSELSEEVSEDLSGEGDTPLGSTDEHSEAPGPHGTE